MNRKKNWLPLP